MTLAVALTSVLYLDSILDRDTVACLQELQEIRLESKKTAKSPVER